MFDDGEDFLKVPNVDEFIETEASVDTDTGPVSVTFVDSEDGFEIAGGKPVVE